MLVHRKGDFVFPVDVLVTFSNGKQVHEHWNGRDRWVRYAYGDQGAILSAEIDPTHEVRLDKDFYNNSRTQEAERSATCKLANYWMVLTQLFSQLLGWLV